jgi:hypothetical protein
MIARIERDFSFSTAVHFDNSFYINYYHITLSMLVKDNSIAHQNIALERIIHFLSSVIQNCIFVNELEKKNIKKYEEAGINVCSLPEDPYDQIISMVLLLKLNKIVEGKLEVAENVLGNVSWWNDASFSIKKRPEDAKIVKLFDTSDWDLIGLSWTKPAKKTEKTDTI